jgi:hypothetical protein
VLKSLLKRADYALSGVDSLLKVEGRELAALVEVALARNGDVSYIRPIALRLKEILDEIRQQRFDQQGRLIAGTYVKRLDVFQQELYSIELSNLPEDVKASQVRKLSVGGSYHVKD